MSPINCSPANRCPRPCSNPPTRGKPPAPLKPPTNTFLANYRLPNPPNTASDPSAIRHPRINLAPRADLLAPLEQLSPGRLSRQLRRLRDIGVIKRVTGTYRYASPELDAVPQQRFVT